MFHNLQAEMYWFYANLDLFFPHTVPRYCVFLWHYRKCKATCKRVFALKRCVILKHTWARGEKGERRQRVSRLYSAFVPVSWILRIFYNLIVHQWVSSQNVTKKNQQIEKKKSLSFFSAVINPFRSGFACDILLLKIFFFPLLRFQALCGGNTKYQGEVGFGYFGKKNKPQIAFFFETSIRDK